MNQKRVPKKRQRRAESSEAPRPAAGGPAWWRFALAALGLVALVGIAYGNGLDNGFVWDDHEQVVMNPYVKAIAPLAPLFAGDVRFARQNQGETTSVYRPLQLLTYRVAEDWSDGGAEGVSPLQHAAGDGRSASGVRDVLAADQETGAGVCGGGAVRGASGAHGGGGLDRGLARPRLRAVYSAGVRRFSGRPERGRERGSAVAMVGIVTGGLCDRAAVEGDRGRVSCAHCVNMLRVVEKGGGQPSAAGGDGEARLTGSCWRFISRSG